MDLMVDAAYPGNIPDGKYHWCMAYANGAYAWARKYLDEFAGHVMIGVYAGQPQQAVYARELDVERYDASVTDVVPFVNYRAQLGHHDATIYASVSTFQSMPPETLLAIPRLHVAWWRNVPGYPTRRQVWQAIGVNDLPENNIWACQYMTVPDQYDVSVIYGERDFVR